MVGAACLSGGELTSEMGKTQEPGADGCAEDVLLLAEVPSHAWLLVLVSLSAEVGSAVGSAFSMLLISACKNFCTAFCLIKV